MKIDKQNKLDKDTYTKKELDTYIQASILFGLALLISFVRI